MNTDKKFSGVDAAPIRPSPVRRALRWLGVFFSVTRASVVMLLFVASLGMFIGGIAVAASKVLFNLASNAVSMVSRQSVRQDHRDSIDAAQRRHSAEILERDRIVERQRVTLAEQNVRLDQQSDILAERERTVARQADAIHARQTRINQLQREVADPRPQAIVNYRGEQRLAKEAVADTAGLVSRRVAFATGRNLAAMPAEALPFFGIAAIAGMTAWELKDACDLMKDVRELDAAFNPDNPISDDEVCGQPLPSRAEIWEDVRDRPVEIWEQARGQIPDLPEVEMPRVLPWIIRQWHWIYCSTIGGDECEH